MKRWAAVARFGGVGDNLMAASVCAPLKRLGYMVEMITSPPNHVVFLHNPYIDKLSVKETDKELPKNDMPRWQEWFQSRAAEYDVFVHLSHSCEGRHSLFPTMTSFWWPVEYRRKICGGSYLETVHDIAQVPYEFGPLFFPTEEEKLFARQVKDQIGKRCIGWVISGSRIDKVYPYSTFAIGRIIKELGIPVVVMGGVSEKEKSMAYAIRDGVAIQNGTREGVHLALPDSQDASKSWPLRSSLTFLLGCDLIVAPDTGPTWAVAFEPMPKVVMVSHASAENITKHWFNTLTLHADPNNVPCWPCHRLHESEATCVSNKENMGAACISDISVERLLKAIDTQWKHAGNGNVVHAEHAFARVL